MVRVERSQVTSGYCNETVPGGFRYRPFADAAEGNGSVICTA